MSSNPTTQNPGNPPINAVPLNAPTQSNAQAVVSRSKNPIAPPAAGQRNATVERNSAETQISVSLNIDGKGNYDVCTGIGFLDHMLTLFAKHGMFDLRVRANGDLFIEDHHTTEDVGILLGEAFAKALGDKIGIERYGSFTLPMDEVLARVAVDLGGRAYSVFKCEFKRDMIGNLATENISHFFDAFARTNGCNLHAEVFYGFNDHHKSEALFKAFSRAMKIACAFDPRAAGVIQSTKGYIQNMPGQTPS